MGKTKVPLLDKENMPLKEFNEIIKRRARVNDKIKRDLKRKEALKNFKLPGGVWRYTKYQMKKRKANYSRLFKVEPKPKVEKVKKPLTIVKPIGGEKNGGTRVVKLKKERKYYPTEDGPKPKRKRKTGKRINPRYITPLKKSITPGTVLIIVAGRHRGKRVVFLKQLLSGLLLVTGPWKLNKCPLRRINQIYTIATSTKLDIHHMFIPKHLTDRYFRRTRRVRKSKKDDGEEIFESKKEEYTVTEERKRDQTLVDDQLMKVIRAQPEYKIMMRYLRSPWCLQNKMYPHQMKF